MKTEISIREYVERDFTAIAELMTELQKSLIPLDPMQQRYMPSDFGEQFVTVQLDKLQKTGGMILLACQDNQAIGCVMGHIKEDSKIESIEKLPAKVALIDELVVRDCYQSQGVGAQLVKAIEKYFRKIGCDFVSLGVYTSNVRARDFYQKMQYVEAGIKMTKKLS